MRKYLSTLFTLFAMCSILTLQAKPKIKTGIEVLKEQNFSILDGKRVGLITNPTGVDHNLKSTIDILHHAKNVKLTALFAPEHGVRGDLHANDKVEHSTDPSTGLPIYSLFGKTKKPTTEMLRDVDILIYDIQDIGSRSFTYISTMGLAMEAAAENNIEFIVLDRPNPLGGIKIEGNVAEDGFITFASKFKIPYIYGLTCGELAKMINGERMINKPCKLTVVEMKGWKRKMNYDETGLTWIPSSPHIPTTESAFMYPASGLAGELAYLSIGVGYTLPFQLFAAEWIDAHKFTATMNSLGLPGIIFRPIHIKPFYSIGKDKRLHGVQVHILNFDETKLSEIQFYVMQEMARMYPDKAVFANADQKRFDTFDNAVGSSYIRETFTRTNKFEDIKNFWYKDVDSFKELSKKYYLYK